MERGVRGDEAPSVPRPPDIYMELPTPPPSSPTPPPQTGDYIVYLLHNRENPCTYVGSTNNPARRIRQHNGELVGGARYTHRNAPTDPAEKWEFYGYIPGLDKHRALSIEKRIQIRSRRMKDRRAIDRRVRAFEEILADIGDPDLKFIIRGS